jgi:hypothetical protein
MNALITKQQIKQWFVVLTAVNMKSTVFLDVQLCSLEGIYLLLLTVCCFAYSSTLAAEVIHSSRIFPEGHTVQCKKIYSGKDYI